MTFRTQFQACHPVSPAPTHILFHRLLVPQKHWAGSTPTFALPFLCHFNVTSSKRSPWPSGSNSLLRPLLLLVFVFVKTGFYYVSLAGQKLCVDQVELPEALPLSLECCCIVPAGVAKLVTLKRSKLCLPWCLLGQGQGKRGLDGFERANGVLSVDVRRRRLPKLGLQPCIL